jgi:hypothetical protein
MTPLLEKPITSALPSPLTSAIILGLYADLQLPAEYPKLLTQVLGAEKPVPVERETTTPWPANPTISARPSALTSASSRGFSLILQDPAEYPKYRTINRGVVKEDPVE